MTPNGEHPKNGPVRSRLASRQIFDAASFVKTPIDGGLLFLSWSRVWIERLLFWIRGSGVNDVRSHPRVTYGSGGGGGGGCGEVHIGLIMKYGPPDRETHCGCVHTGCVTQ